MPQRILICTAQVPFARGGAELLVEGLRDALRERGYMVDVVALPYAWQPHDRLMSSALAWRLLDLERVNGAPVDQIICTKFPSYAARHARKVVWLVHQHRQAYDWYGTPLSDFANTPEDRAIRDHLLRMDRATLGEAQRLFAISQNVAARLKRFVGLEAQPLYPPSRYASRLRAGPYGDYLLSDARLDAAKRLDLLLHALARTRQPVRCVFIGAGDDRARLERLAADLNLGARVVFRGFVSDDELIDLYTSARAVYYAPFDEDYGFTAVQALAAARPVITTTDSGGVREFVADGVTGLVAPPEPDAIATQIDAIFEDAALAARLGAAGPARVADITWDRVIRALLLR
ncbi:MAG: glycosyl transferase family 1 [Roseiflexus castenholzii]|uniref:glycosyltransferase family 4 protein n=1 Tax=Roseiflexus castenholzii TaxID=120962 RepID=UPI000CC04D26|nr:MAG: glycosyl transferase family 1 [Roseiflexus castenholzii]